MMNILNRKISERRPYVMVLILFFIFGCCCIVPTVSAGIDVGKTVPLKIRVHLSLEPSNEEKAITEGADSYNYNKISIQLKASTSQQDSPEAAIERDTLLRILRMTKSAVTESEVIRVMENDAGVSKIWSIKKENPVLYVMQVTAEYYNQEYRVFFKVIDKRNGDIYVSSEAVSSKVERAVNNAVHDLEQGLVLKPWHCTVDSVAGNGHIIIPRGSEDGLYDGLKFIGHALNGETARKREEPEELKILKYAGDKGVYRVVETKRNYAKLLRLQNSPGLAPGDIIEMPGVAIKNKNKQSRGHKAWQQIYKK